MRRTALPPGPSAGPLAQTVAFHRDPLGVLRAAQGAPLGRPSPSPRAPRGGRRAARAGWGAFFAWPLPGARRVVGGGGRGGAGPLLPPAPGAARPAPARRTILPLASPRSVFGA